MQLAVIHTVPGEIAADHVSEWRAAASAGTDVNVIPVEEGPSAIVDELSARTVAPFVVAQASSVQRAADVIIIGCAADPGLAEVRAASEIPVLGVGESLMLAASRSAAQFSVVTVVDPDWIAALADTCQLTEQLLSVTRIATPPEDLRNRREQVIDELIEHACEAVSKGAQAVCLGCCSFAGLSGLVQRAAGVTVLDPKITTMQIAEQVALRGQASDGEGPASQAKSELVWDRA